uniref:Transmembrane protein 247 n=1 Tax=Laticauda laticaudata TaxID=8630 RepID=A0A8C5WVA7_LATLA
MRQRQGNLHIVSQKVSGCSPAEATAETASVAFAEMGKMRIELQLALEVYRPEMKEKKLSGERNGHQETPKCEQQLETTSEVKKANMPPEQRNDGVTEHLGLQVPRIVVNGAESQWSSSRLDLAIETELEKRRMEFELTRLRYEHEENERQRQHEQKMEQLRQQEMRLQRMQKDASLPHPGGHHFLLPHDPLTLFLYCFIFIHLIYIAKELIFFFFKKHGMFAIGAVLIFAIKIFWN